jgi:hypothetical protein
VTRSTDLVDYKLIGCRRNIFNVLSEFARSVCVGREFEVENFVTVSRLSKRVNDSVCVARRAECFVHVLDFVGVGSDKRHFDFLCEVPRLMNAGVTV